jgi:hypothetical protein
LSVFNTEEDVEAYDEQKKGLTEGSVEEEEA